MTDDSTDGTSAEPTIRPAKPGDLSTVRLIQEAALTDPWPDLLELGVEGSPLTLVVETDRPVGYALVVPGDAAAYIAEFAVAPNEQGRGYGSTLLGGLIDRLETDGYEMIRLTARADDERARSFYEQFGFTVVENVPDHYEDADGVILQRTL